MLRHLLGTRLEQSDPKFQNWDEDNIMILTWLWNLILPEISGTCMFLSTAKEVWKVVRQIYSKVCDAAQIFEIKSKISATKQGEWSVTEYSNILKNLWQGMDHYQGIQMKCGKEATMLKRFVKKERIF